MSIDANLLYGLELGFGVGIFVGLCVGAVVLFLVSKAVQPTRGRPKP
jgi:hypothetical protein